MPTHARTHLRGNLHRQLPPPPPNKNGQPPPTPHANAHAPARARAPPPPSLPPPQSSPPRARAAGPPAVLRTPRAHRARAPACARPAARPAPRTACAGAMSTERRGEPGISIDAGTYVVGRTWCAASSAGARPAARTVCAASASHVPPSAPSARCVAARSSPSASMSGETPAAVSSALTSSGSVEAGEVVVVVEADAMVGVVVDKAEGLGDGKNARRAAESGCAGVSGVAHARDASAGCVDCGVGGGRAVGDASAAGGGMSMRILGGGSAADSDWDWVWVSEDSVLVVEEAVGEGGREGPGVARFLDIRVITNWDVRAGVRSEWIGVGGWDELRWTGMNWCGKKIEGCYVRGCAPAFIARREGKCDGVRIAVRHCVRRTCLQRGRRRPGSRGGSTATMSGGDS